PYQCTPPRPAPPSFPTRRSSDLELLARRLEAIGCQTQVASSGERAIALARTEQPDLILLDVMMPGIDGWQTCRRLKSQPETAERSEEHTSELQSRFDLVCRLLLE